MLEKETAWELKTDEGYMRLALDLAKNARGRTSPNPLVGAVIVKDDRVVGVGWHRKAGTPHAEIHALNMAGDLAKGATLYVTLEPCSHYGRTGPCAKAVIDAGISRVVMGMIDPNPKVHQQGLNMLKSAGIITKVGVLEQECKKLNEDFLTWVQEKRPFTILKTAMSLDGKIAAFDGTSQWITGEQARLRGHEYRDTVDAIMVGIGTALQDNPSLTARLPHKKTKNPIRVVVDSLAKIPLSAKLITDGKARTIVAVTENAPLDRVDALQEKGVEIITAGNNEVDLKLLMSKLAEKNICSVLVEGGGKLSFSLLKAGLIDKVHAFIAPKIIGGETALTPVEGGGFSLAAAVKLNNITTEMVGEDILVTGYIEKAVDLR